MQVIKVLMYNTEDVLKYAVSTNNPEPRAEVFYTITDGRGNYPLTKGDTIWYDDSGSKALKLAIDGKPKAGIDKESMIHEINGKLGMYDNRLKMIEGPFDDIEEAGEFLLGYLDDRFIRRYINPEDYDDRI